MARRAKTLPEHGPENIRSGHIVKLTRQEHRIARIEMVEGPGAYIWYRFFLADTNQWLAVERRPRSVAMWASLPSEAFYTLGGELRYVNDTHGSYSCVGDSPVVIRRGRQRIPARRQLFTSIRHGQGYNLERIRIGDTIHNAAQIAQFSSRDVTVHAPRPR